MDPVGLTTLTMVLAMGLVDTAMRSLDEVSVQANRDPRPAYAAFARAC